MTLTQSNIRGVDKFVKVGARMSLSADILPQIQCTAILDTMNLKTGGGASAP